MMLCELEKTFSTSFIKNTVVQWCAYALRLSSIDLNNHISKKKKQNPNTTIDGRHNSIMQYDDTLSVYQFDASISYYNCKSRKVPLRLRSFFSVILIRFPHKSMLRIVVYRLFFTPLSKITVRVDLRGTQQFIVTWSQRKKRFIIYRFNFPVIHRLDQMESHI